MGSGNSTIRPDSYESKSLKQMKNDWVNTVKSVYKFGLLEDIQLAYDNINIYKGEYCFVFDPDTPMYTFDYVHEVLENKNLDLDTVSKWFHDNKVQITPRTMISAVKSGNMDAVKLFCKDGTMNPLSNNFYPVVYYDGHDGIMNTKLLYKLKDIESGKRSDLTEEESEESGCCSVSISENPEDEEEQERKERKWKQYHDDRMDKETMFTYVSKFWKICVGPILIQEAIKEGHLDILKWLISEGITDPSKSLNYRSIHEDKNLLDFLLENGYKLSDETTITAMGIKNVEYLDELLDKKCPIDTSIEHVPGEYNMHTFFGGSYINVLSGLVASNPDHRVFKWAVDHGFKFRDGHVDVSELIIKGRVDILEYLFENRAEDVQLNARNGMKYIIENHPELVMKVLDNGACCDNYMRREIFKFGNVDFMEYMKKNDLLKDTKRDETDDNVFHHCYSHVLNDSLQVGNTIVAQWALDNGYDGGTENFPERKCLSFSIIAKSYEGTKWALEKGLTFFEENDGWSNETVVEYICHSYKMFELFKDIVDFKAYENVFNYEEGVFKQIHPDIIKELEELGIVVTLPYKSVDASNLDWEFVRKWKKCKTWDQDKFMKQVMKYRHEIVPEELQEILNES